MSICSTRNVRTLAILSTLSLTFIFLFLYLVYILKDCNDISITALTFSKDAKFLLTLGSLPTHQLSLFDLRHTHDPEWPDIRKKLLLATTLAPHSANTVAFDPLDSKLFSAFTVAGLVDLSIAKLGDEFGDDECEEEFLTRSVHGVGVFHVEICLKETKIVRMYRIGYLKLFERPFKGVGGYVDRCIQVEDCTWTNDHMLIIFGDSGTTLIKYDTATEVFIELSEVYACSERVYGVAFNLQYFIFLGKDNTLYYFSKDTFKWQKSAVIVEKERAVSIFFFLSFEDMFYITEGGSLKTYDPESKSETILATQPRNVIASYVSINNNNRFLIYERDGFFLLNRNGILLQFLALPADYSTHTVHPNSTSIILIGTQKGHLNLYLLNDGQVKVVALGKCFDCPIIALKYSLDGEILCAVSTKGELKTYNAQDYKLRKAFKTTGTPSNIISTRLEINETKKYSFLTVSYEASGKTSQLNLITADKSDTTLRNFDVEGIITELCALDMQPEDDLLTLFAIVDKQKIIKYKIGEIDVRRLTSRDQIDITNDPYDLSMYIFFNLMLTYSSDGKIIVRNLLDKKKAVKEVRAHDALTGGVVSIHLLEFGKSFVTIGRDGVIKFWKSKNINVHRPSLAAFVDKKEVGVVIDKALKRHLELVDVVEVVDTGLSTISNGNSKDEEKLGITLKITEIKDKLSRLIQQDALLPESERISPEDFIIDFEERDRMARDIEQDILTRRTTIKASNLHKSQTSDYLKLHFWDTMEVVSKHILSFDKDPLYARRTDVCNYSTQHTTDKERDLLKKLKLLRKVSKIVETHTGNKGGEEDDRIDASHEVFMFADPELITEQRKRMQVAFLSEIMKTTKANFNLVFEQSVRVKNECLAKVDAISARIQDIIKEIGSSEKFDGPEIDESEAPERTLEVKDSEVTGLKWVSTFEKKKLAAKKMQDAQRLQSEDDGRERALMKMMNGTLDEKSKLDFKEEIIRPDCADKHISEMSEDEKKLFKEWEKRVAFRKEEDEKYRKSLESEMRKLITSITEIYVKFDTDLKDLERTKLKADSCIYRNEIAVLKLVKCSIDKLHVSMDEQAQIKTINAIKSRKTIYATETQEIKKILENLKDECDSAQRKEREADKHLKREFDIHHPHFATLKPYFKYRSSRTFNSYDSNPFQTFTQLITEKFKWMEEEEDTVMEEDLPLEVKSKFNEMRTEKMNHWLEATKQASRVDDVHEILLHISEQNDKIKQDYERLNKQREVCVQRMQMLDYDAERLLNLKHANIEISQEPVSTDYSRSLMINRSIIETLNVSIVEVGLKKVEALKDMKTYRRGIHAIEWENQVLDWKSEELTLKARDVQMLRVTKDIQEYLRSGDDQKQLNEIKTLEKQIHAYERNIEIKRKELLKAQRDIKKMQLHCADLVESTKVPEELVQALKNQTEQIETNKVEGVQIMRGIVYLREMKDKNLLNIQNIGILNEEIYRLRLKTFTKLN